MIRTDSGTLANALDLDVAGWPSIQRERTASADLVGVRRIRFVDWDEVHAVVQGRLADLADRVAAELPGVLTRTGRVSDRFSPLFSYRVFYHIDGDDYDPMLAGVTFTPRGGRWRVVGDICGEETGHIYFDDDCEGSVPGETAALLAEARRIAGRLADQSELVARHLKDRHPDTVPR